MLNFCKINNTTINTWAENPAKDLKTKCQDTHAQMAVGEPQGHHMKGESQFICCQEGTT